MAIRSGLGATHRPSEDRARLRKATRYADIIYGAGLSAGMDFETSKIDAISEWVPGYPPIVLVNSNEEIPTSRLRLTLAHEIGHLVMHQLSSSPDIEDEANRFAAEFMMPRREIKASLYRLNLAKLTDLKRDWKVSMPALVYL